MLQMIKTKKKFVETKQKLTIKYSVIVLSFESCKFINPIYRPDPVSREKNAEGLTSV